MSSSAACWAVNKYHHYVKNNQTNVENICLLVIQTRYSYSSDAVYRTDPEVFAHSHFKILLHIPDMYCILFFEIIPTAIKHPKSIQEYYLQQCRINPLVTTRKTVIGCNNENIQRPQDIKCIQYLYSLSETLEIL